MATWDDVPHLDERTKEMLFASYAIPARRPHFVSALGKVGRLPGPADIVVPEISISQTTGRDVMALMSSWNRTAAIWGERIDRERRPPRSTRRG